MRRPITKTAGITLAVGVAAIGIAACGGGGDDGNATAAEGGGGGTALVSVGNVDGTRVLMDSQGRTLYSAQVEKDGHIRCTDGCTSFWKPQGASAMSARTAAAKLNLDLGVARRPDGVEQLSFDGKPLYTFTQEGPGELQGDGFTDDFGGTHFEWTAAKAGGASSSTPTTPSNGSSGGYSGY